MAIAYKDAYLEMDEKYVDKTYLMAANTLLTWSSDIDASRLYMTSAETRQSLTMLNPDVARLQTGYENPLGRRNKNKSYKQLDGTWEVKDIIRKYVDGDIYTVVFYNEDTDTYDMLEKKIAKNLIEKFGYIFNTETMDSLKVGNKITDEVIYKSTSYDKHMNYRYGKNAKVYYSTSTDTLEDAVKIRKGWADGIETVEVDAVDASININHIPLNLYGEGKEYRPCPKIGETIKNSRVLSLRMLNKSHILTDMQNENLKKPYNTDETFLIADAKRSYVYDVDVRFNTSKGEFPDNKLYKQLKEWYDQGCAYADAMYAWAKKIKDSGSKYTKNIPFFIDKYAHWNDPEWTWCSKEKNKPIGWMKVEFKTVSILGLVPGSKIAGRYGDKGVIATVADDIHNNTSLANTMDSILDMLGRPVSEEERLKLADQIQIVPDSEMPYTDDFPVDIILNASGAIRRLNPGQIDEVDINFISEAIRKKVCELPTMEEKENLIFDYLGRLNENECSFFYEMYKSFDQEVRINNHNVMLTDLSEKERFIKNIETYGFYIRKDLDSNIRYEAIKSLYEHFDFIKPLPLYIDIFGTKKRRIIKDGIVADKYMQILKHNSNKNFSARSTFRVNRANLPVKDTTKRDNKSQYSKSPVRIGEAYNLMSSISGALLAEYNIFMRSSTLGRKSLKRILETEGNPLEIKRMKVQDNYINTNADIFAARIKGIGLGVEFVRGEDETPNMIEDAIMPLQIGKFVIYDSPLRKFMYNKLFAEFMSRMESTSVMQSYIGEKEDIIWKEVFELEEVKAFDIPKEVKEMIVNISKNKGVDIEEGYTEA